MIGIARPTPADASAARRRRMRWAAPEPSFIWASKTKMRRFSQRNSLVTLSDINITPLLDLAFVLLIIFVITTPLLEQGLNLRLPQTTPADQKRLDPRDIRTVDV